MAATANRRESTPFRGGDVSGKRVIPNCWMKLRLRRGAEQCVLAGDLTSAATAYHDALQIARKQKDLILSKLSASQVWPRSPQRKNAMTSFFLSTCPKPALPLAQSLDAQRSLAQILGNMAWGYRKLGDFDIALAFYKRAEEVSAHAGFH